MLAGSLVVHASRVHRVHSAAGTAAPQRADIGDKACFSGRPGGRIRYPASGWAERSNVLTFNVITL